MGFSCFIKSEMLLDSGYLPLTNADPGGQIFSALDFKPMLLAVLGAAEKLVLSHRNEPFATGPASARSKFGFPHMAPQGQAV
jgi:hypothetical protein